MNANKPKYLVKFLPYSQSVISGLINKTVKFSSAYEFNDFNELHIIGHLQGISPEFDLASYITDFQFLSVFHKYYSRHEDTDSFVDKILSSVKILDQKSLIGDESYRRVLVEWVSYYLVGIMSLSDLAVFDDDSAALMYAHYSRNATGVALVYEIAQDNLQPQQVQYTPSHQPSGEVLPTRYYTENLHEKLPQWEKNNFSEMEDFLRKSEKWSYEKEWRIFGNPGVTEASSVGLTLKSILYTSRFNVDEIDALKKINHHFYNGEILLQKIHTSISRDHYDVDDGDKNVSVIEWLKGKFPNFAM